MQPSKRHIKLRGNDAALVLRADGKAQMDVSFEDLDRARGATLGGVQPTSPQCLYIVALMQLFEKNEFSDEIWGRLLDRLRASEKRIIVP